MQDRGYGFFALLAVIGVSIVFGMILGGKLNAPQVAMAAPRDNPVIHLAPASTAAVGMTDFADIVERSLPAIVAVTAAQIEEGSEEAEGDGAHPFMNDPFFRRFFGEPDSPEPRPRQRPRIGEGSGFIISIDGYILTNHHVVEDSTSVQITLNDGGSYEATIVGTDPSIDLALLKIDPGRDELPILPLGDSAALRVGEWVIAIGNALEFDQTVTVGVISGKGRRVPIGSTDLAVVSFLQTDAAINFGNSGGPLLDARGNVVGINTAINRQFLAEGIGFALPINQARGVVEQLRERGYVRRGYIGITMNRNGLDDAAREFYELPDNHGVIISNVQAGGPSARAGLRAGDVIRKVNGEKVENNFDLVSKIASHQPGDEVKLEVFRKEASAKQGETVKFSVTLADREEAMAAMNDSGDRRTPEPEPEPEIQEAEGFGLTLETLTSRSREQLGLPRERSGLLVTDVEFGSSALDKGIRPNMIIVAINGETVENVGDWQRLLETLPGGASVKLDVVDGEQLTYVFLRMPRSD